MLFTNVTEGIDVIFCVHTDLELEFETVETGKKGVHCIRVRYVSDANHNMYPYARAYYCNQETIRTTPGDTYRSFLYVCNKYVCITKVCMINFIKRI